MKRIFLAAMLSTMAGAASAATFTLGAGSDDQHSVTLTEDGSTVVVSAFRDYASRTQDVINRHSAGWGVGFRGPEGIMMAANEALVFDFAPITHRLLRSVIFEKGAEEETVDLYVDDVYVTTFTIPADSDSATTRAYSTFDVSSDLYRGEAFAFVATSPEGDGWRGVRVREISVEAVLTAVPLPAGAILLMSGLGILSLRRRGKTA